MTARKSKSKRNPLPITPAMADAVSSYAGYQLTGAAAVQPVGRFLKRMERNPAKAAARGFKDFHGTGPAEEIVVERDVHYHRHLSGAGELKRLVIAAVDGKSIVTLTRFQGAVLAFNERRNQLFIEGGDTGVDLADFGIDPDDAHELETLGKVTSLDYFTSKSHLGDEGGEAVYRHKLRTTNEDGKHITVRVARYPDAIYRVLDQRIEFSGGSYKIIPEGIDL